MGAVHGVHLKYAAMSAMSAAGAYRLADEPTQLELSSGLGAAWPSTQAMSVLVLLWCCIIHALITSLFLLRRGQWLIGKSASGIVPLWSHVLWSAFHLPTWLYTYVHTALSSVPVASEVAPGWWIGGRYGARLSKKWSATIDLTVEFTEGCRDTTREYLCIPCWDGQPPPPADIERAAKLAAAAIGRGDVMVHCAHGRGRSTCVMVACLVRAGLHATWREAYAAVQPRRPGVKLNGKMRRALDEWEAAYGRGRSD
jgi:protein-tyrosine phosphatase